MSDLSDDELATAMNDIARSHREVFAQGAGLRPAGAQLGEIFIAYKFREILREYGFTIVPNAPTAAMIQSWQHGWFRSFHHRYGDMLLAAWPDNDATTTAQQKQAAF
jgi:hypothetical protein